jgi:hypothetical protein
MPDPRDKVFWHYGNLHCSLKDQFPINYFAEVGTVYRDLTVALIRWDDLDICPSFQVPGEDLQ